MNKQWIGSICQDSKGIICESWRGGGIANTILKKRYDDGYHFVHACQDTHDDDVSHYTFQKDDSNEFPGSCWVCGINLAIGEYDGSSPNEQQIDIRLAPRTRDILEDPATKQQWSLGTRLARAFINRYGL